MNIQSPRRIVCKNREGFRKGMSLQKAEDGLQLRVGQNLRQAKKYRRQVLSLKENIL